MFFGGLPVITTYQARVTSNFIQPGSSGSAVFNSDGYIAGLVFAGSGPISWAHIVPAEYVNYFVNKESKLLEASKPEEGTASFSQSARAKLRTTCLAGITDVNYELVKQYCQYLDTDALYEE